jgi:cytochrome c oxidase subunit 2
VGLESWLPKAASSFAGDVDWLLGFITWIVGIWFLAAEGILIFFVLRYRRRPGVRAAYVPARRLRAMAFVLVPCAAILGFDLVIDAVAAPIWHRIKETLPPAQETIRITGEQWAWRFRLPGPDGRLDTADDIEVVNELHLPVDAVVQFELTAKDVIHSFWMPEMRLKQDAVPGRTIRGWFQPTRVGHYEMDCAQICGLGHTMMKASVVVESREAYESWVREKAGSAQVTSREEGPESR